MAFNPFELSCDGFEGFVPRNGTELTISAPSYPSKRLHQPVRVILAAEIGPSTDTGTKLGCDQRIRAVIGVEAGDLAVLNVGDEQAATTAVVSRAANADQFFRGGWGR